MAEQDEPVRAQSRDPGFSVAYSAKVITEQEL